MDDRWFRLGDHGRYVALNENRLMAYEIHIERVTDDGDPDELELELDEWKSIVAAKDCLRLNFKHVTVTNPATGEEISASRPDGCADMLIGDQWLPVFQWRAGAISFKGQPSFEDQADPIRQMATQIAIELDARVVGDEGEFYN